MNCRVKRFGCEIGLSASSEWMADLPVFDYDGLYVQGLSGHDDCFLCNPGHDGFLLFCRRGFCDCDLCNRNADRPFPPSGTHTRDAHDGLQIHTCNGIRCVLRDDHAPYAGGDRSDHDDRGHDESYRAAYKPSPGAPYDCRIRDAPPDDDTICRVRDSSVPRKTQYARGHDRRCATRRQIESPDA